MQKHDVKYSSIFILPDLPANSWSRWRIFVYGHSMFSDIEQYLMRSLLCRWQLEANSWWPSMFPDIEEYFLTAKSVPTIIKMYLYTNIFISNEWPIISGGFTIGMMSLWGRSIGGLGLMIPASLLQRSDTWRWCAFHSAVVRTWSRFKEAV